jgi:hypothetical protein
LELNTHGTVLAVASDDAALLVHPVTGVVLAGLRVAATDRLKFSLDDRRLITASHAGTARVWNVGIELPAAPPAPSTYTADRADDDRDLLKRSRDVEAFASLIAARTVEAPLSIGLFGDWGSGKSWFMGQLRRRVAAIAADARESGALQREVTFFKHIAQVEFNAWHYAEGDVLASLVDHIFSRLDLGEGVGYVEQEQARRLKEVAAAQLESLKAEQDRERSAKELADIQQERRDKERQREIQRAELEAAIPELAPAVPTELQRVASGALAAIGWGRVPEVVSELRHELVAARTELGRGAGLLTPLVRGQPGEVTRRRWVALVLLAAGPLAALLVGAVVAALSTEAKAVLSGAGALLVAGVGGVSSFVSQQTRWLRQRLDDLDEAERRIDGFIAEQLKEIDREIAKLRDKELEKQEEVDKKAVALTTTQEALEKTQAKLSEATPTRLLQDLIQGTVKAGEYARRLGVVAQARHDFENVSDIIRSLNVELEGMTSLDQEKDVRLNRIVLYIDDLDRCEPDKVVQVLQAVHLLLAFPLFVVVVGVDSRWVARALQKRYPELLDAGGATPNDYLEKIFQIPFWLDPLDVGKTKRMLQGLVAVTPAVAPARRPTPAPTEEPSGVPSQDGGAPDTGAEQEVEPAVAPPAPDRVAGSRELNPRGLELQPVELQAMEALAEVVGRSPRTLKRFVNVYRLVKVRLADPLDFVESSRADYRVVLYLLAFMTGRPDAGAELFDAIRSLADDAPMEDVPEGWPATAGPYKRWVDDIARFSFDMRRPPMLPPAAPPPAAAQPAASLPA